MEEVAMHTTVKPSRDKLPGRYGDLVRTMPPQAITDDVHHEATVKMIDRLMAPNRLTKDQRLYLETLVQLVQAYEDSHHNIDTDDISGIDALRQLLSDNGMSASDLGRLLGMHASMGSKILKGERALTVEHLRKLADRFKVQAGLFMA